MPPLGAIGTIENPPWEKMDRNREDARTKTSFGNRSADRKGVRGNARRSIRSICFVQEDEVYEEIYGTEPLGIPVIYWKTENGEANFALVVQRNSQQMNKF